MFVKRPVNSVTAGFFSGFGNGVAAATIMGMSGVVRFCCQSASESVISTILADDNVSGLHLYSGSEPTPEELDALASLRPTSLAALPRYSDLLIRFKGASGNSFAVELDVVKMAFKQAVALREGTASWYMLYGAGSQGYAISGPISELELLTTAIHKDSVYRFPVHSLRIPSKM